MRLLLFAFMLLLLPPATTKSQPRLNENYVIVIHGGAGTILKNQMTPQLEAQYRAALSQALKLGHDTLKHEGSALDAVEVAIRYMEDSPLFNAGKGAVLNNEGKAELDASIMDGATQAAGSVAGVTTIRNPVTAARAVMEKSAHVMLTGRGAEKFAASQGLEIKDPSYFLTEKSTRALQLAKRMDSAKQKSPSKKMPDPGALKQSENNDYKYGTVGAVALDRYGNLAAATSTGGMTNKKFGRVGDTPIIGAGTYAKNSTCAVSCTGWGEFFIRLVLAKSVSDLVEYKGLTVEKAGYEMIRKELPALGGDGGLIALDNQGNFTMVFNTEGMYRGYMRGGKKAVVEIYKEESISR